jgi:hypothetical protein
MAASMMTSLHSNAGIRGAFAAGIAMLAGFAFFAPAQCLGWYGCMFFPFVAMGWAVGMRRLWRKPYTLQSRLTLVLLACAALISAITVLPDQRGALRLTYAGVTALSIVPPLRSNCRHLFAFRLAILALLLFGLMSEIIELLGREFIS